MKYLELDQKQKTNGELPSLLDRFAPQAPSRREKRWSSWTEYVHDENAVKWVPSASLFLSNNSFYKHEGD